MYPEVLHLGFLHLRSYGLMMAVAFLVGTFLGLREARRLSLDEDKVVNVILITLIASVLVNRLRQGMRLQADPTVIYAIGDKFDGNLTKRDLDGDSAYNTYTRDGLPPTPIALPSQAALDAATRPPASEYLYFVSRGDGTSAFSANLADHNRAVARFQKAPR